MSLLDKILGKRGITDITDMTQEEQQTYDTFKRLLEREITVETIAEFVKAEKERSINELSEKYYELSNDARIFYSAHIRICNKLVKYITNFKIEKEVAIKNLSKLHNVDLED
jgi:hypothetical protein